MTIEQMRERLLQTFPDAKIEVSDLTGTSDHWQVSVTCAAFRGLNRIQAQRKVMDAFSPELKTGEVHALTIKTSAGD